MQRKRPAITFVSTLVLIIALFTGPVVADKFLQPECVDAEQWVSDNRGDLPDTHEGLFSLPPAYRVRAFAALSPVDQSRLFREHYMSFLQEYPELTSQQVALIHEVMDLETPDLYRHQEGEHPGGREADEKMFNRFVDAFSLEQLKKLSLGLAPTKPNYLSLASLRTNLRSGFAGLLANFAPVAHAQWDCDCYWELLCSLIGGACFGGACVPTPSGCGFLWCEPCTTFCWY